MAVVGNVGTYAQVQPVQGPDFGGMVKDQFDKLDAERKAKAKREEEAKAKKQAELDKLSIPEMEMLNINGLQDQRYNYWKSKVSEFARLKEAGDYNGAQRLINSLESEANAVKQTNAKIKSYYENEEKYDENYFKKVIDLTTAVDKGNVDIVDKGDGELRYNIYKDAEKKELLYEGITPFEYISKIEVPFKFDSTKEAKSFASTFRLDEIDKEIDTKTKYGTVQSKDLMDNERVLSRINDKAEEYIDDDRAMAHFGKTINKYETRASNYTEEEKREAKDYFTKLLKDAYQEEVELRISQKSKGRGGSGGKEEFSFNPPVVFESPYINLGDSTSKPTAEQIKKGYKSETTMNFTTEEYKKNPVRSITVGKGNTALNVSNMPLDQIVYDPVRKKIFLGISRPVRSSANVRGNQVSGGVGDSEKETIWLDAKDPKFQAFKANASRVLGTKIETEADVIKYFFLNNL